MARPAIAPRQLSLAEQIEAQIDELAALLPIAHDERRPAVASDRLLDGLSGIGRTLQRLGRG